MFLLCANRFVIFLRFRNLQVLNNMPLASVVSVEDVITKERSLLYVLGPWPSTGHQLIVVVNFSCETGLADRYCTEP